MGSLVKSCTLFAFFSHTMSRWPCRQMLGAPSRPFDAGLRTTTLPAASCLEVRPNCLAMSITNAAAAASDFEQRGMRASAAK